MPPGWSRRAGSGPPPSAASAFTPRCRSRPHRIPVEPDLEREGVRAETYGGFDLETFDAKRATLRMVKGLRA